MDTKRLKPLLGALNAGYRHRPHEMLGFFVSKIFTLWELPEWQPIPDDARPKVAEAIEAYSSLVCESEPFLDVLGPLYMELASHGGRQHLGQFFTPWPIASMMAAINASAPPPDHEDLVRVCDPACGSGVMLLAFTSHALSNWGPDALLRLSLTGCDIDSYCARLTALQLVANCNLHKLQLGEIIVQRGDSLWPDKGMETIVHATAPSVVAPRPAQAPERLVALAAAAQGQAQGVYQQQELFAA